METININMTPNCHEVETIHASQNDTSLRKWGIRPYDYEGNDVTNQQDKATLVDIKGQTLKWNQLVENGNFESTSTWRTYLATISSSNNILTYTSTSDSGFNTLTQDKTITQNHKYLVSFDLDANGVTTNVHVRSPFNSAYSVATGRKVYSMIGTGVENNIVIQFNPLPSGSVVYIRNVMCFDLTQMGLDSLTDAEILQWFEDYFPLNYYSYNSGSLIPFMGNGLKTVGFNQWDEEWEAGALSVTDGSTLNVNTYLRSKNFIPVISGKTYCRGISYQSDCRVFYYDANQNYVGNVATSSANTLFTIPSSVAFIKFHKNGANYDNNICINISDTSKNGTYEPYTESVINLPISTYFPTGMKSIEPNQYTTVEITDELIPTKATTRVGSITIGGNTPMIPNGATSEFSAFIMPINGKANGEYNIMSDLFEVGSGKAYTTCGRAGNNNVEFSLPPSVPQTVADAHAWFTQHPTTLYFELATPTETDISPELDLTFNIDKGGTEELLPSGLLNGSVDLGSLTWTYESGWRAFKSMIADAKRVASSLNANWFCSRYSLKGSRFSGDTSADMTVDLNSISHADGVITIRDTSFNGDTTAFKNSLQGVYLWYEKSDSTPTTTPLNATIKYPAETKDVYFTYQVSDFLSTVFKFYLVTKGIQIPCELEDDTLVIDCTSEISNESGFFDCKIKAENDLGQIFSNKFQLHIERSPQ